MGSGTSVGGRMFVIASDNPNINLPVNSVAFRIAFCTSILPVFVGGAFGDGAKVARSFLLAGAEFGSSVLDWFLLRWFVGSPATGTEALFPLSVVCVFFGVCGLKGLGLLDRQGPAKGCNLLFRPVKNFSRGMTLQICRTHRKFSNPFLFCRGRNYSLNCNDRGSASCSRFVSRFVLEFLKCEGGKHLCTSRRGGFSNPGTPCCS